MSEPSTLDGIDRDSFLMVGAAVALLAVFLYSVLVVQQVLAFVAVVLWVFGVYLVWRFVRAHERLADAAEALATAGRVERDSAEKEEVDGGVHAVREPEGETE